MAISVNFRLPFKVDFKPKTGTKIVPSDEDGKKIDTFSTNKKKRSYLPKWNCCHMTRYLMLLVVLLCLTFLWSNILTYNFTIVCITDTERETSSTDATDDALLVRDTSEETAVIVVVAAAAIVANYPVGWLLRRFGTRRVFTLLGMLSATCTAIIPVARSASFALFIVLRIGQGIAFTSSFPVMGGLVSRWSSLAQSGLFLSVLTCFFQVAPSITNNMAGPLCLSSLGWPAVYYFHAGITIVLFTMLAIFYRDSPDEHPMVGTAELHRIKSGKFDTNASIDNAVPYMAILKTPAVWAVWIGAFGCYFGTAIVQLYSPTYLNEVIKLPESLTGVASAMPSIVQIIVKVLAGFASDHVYCIAEKYKIRIWNTIATFGMAAFFICMTIVPPTSKAVIVVLLICADGILGAKTGGFFKSCTLLSRHYAQFVMGNITIAFSIGMFIVPFIVQSIAVDNTVHEWDTIFYILVCVLVVTDIIFCLFASAAAAKWTEVETAPTTTINNEDDVIELPETNHQNVGAYP